MFKLPVVTVIIPSYDHTEYVEAAIGSVLSQTLKNIEVVVVDDGSTDGSQEKISKIKDPRLKFIPLKENRREHPRNLALSMARGRYIAFQNSDDEWLPEKLENQVSFMEKNKKTVACFTRVDLINGNGAAVTGTWMDGAFNEPNMSRFKWLQRFFEKGNCLCISSSMVRSSALKRIGHFCPSLFYLSDLDLWVRLAGIGDLHIIEDALTKMRVIEGKNLSSPSERGENIRFMEFARVLSRYTEAPIINDIERIFLGQENDRRFIASKFVFAARKALGVGKPEHLLFADRTFSFVLENKELRKQALDLFGPGLINEFLKTRGKIRVGMNDENII